MNESNKGDMDRRPDNLEILNLAIEMYGEDDRMEHCRKTLDKLSRELCYWKQNPQIEDIPIYQRVAEAIMDLTQIKKILGEREIDRALMDETDKLYKLLKTESEREIEIVEGKYSEYSQTYAWANPNGLKCVPGGLAIAEFGTGELPIIVKKVSKRKRGTISLKYKIVKGTTL